VLAVVGDPVVADGALVPVGAEGPADEHVVAALALDVVVARAADDDVVASDRVVLELVGVVPLGEVGVRATLDPVVTLAGEDVRRRVVAAHPEAVPVAREQQVHAGTAVDGVVAETALDVVVAEAVREDVVARSADDLVVPGTTLDAVVPAVAPQRVVTLAAA